MSQQISMISLGDVEPYAKNSRTHSDSQVVAIANSIDEFGMVGGIVIRNGVIAKGHGTFSAIKLLLNEGKKIYPPPGRKSGAQPYPDGQIPVIDASGWSEAQFKAYVIADNRIAQDANWDWDLLSSEVFDLSLTELDLNILGFDDKEFDLIQSVGEQRRGARRAGNEGQTAGAFQIIVECSDEDEQRALLDKFIEDGLTVRALM